MILNLRAVLNSHTTALGILMTCATAWLQAQIEAETDPQKLRQGMEQMKAAAGQAPPEFKPGIELLMKKAEARLAELESGKK